MNLSEIVDSYKILIMQNIQPINQISIMIRIIPVILLITTLLLSFDRNDNKIFYQEKLLDIAGFIEENEDQYSRFYDIMTVGKLTDPLSAYNPFGNGFTLFLPTNEAFDKYIQNSNRYSSFNELLQDIDFVRVLGRYHLVNAMLHTNEFPYGALPDTTATGDLLTIGFSSNLDTTVYKVNNLSPIIIANLEMLNGYIHIIGEVLEPVNYTGYEWLTQHAGYTILSEAFKITGLKDTLGLYRLSGNNQLVKNKYTIFAEHDSIYARYGIHSIDDLINKYSTPGMELTNSDNDLYQFAAYHILEGSYFLDEFEGKRNYNSYANYPLSISAGLDICINFGADTFAIQISGEDTTIINYIRLYYQESNVLTKNGPIHVITDVMELFKPARSSRIFQFTEEPLISEAGKTANTYEFIDPNEFEEIYWTGAKKIIYVKSSSTSEKASAKDYIQIEGNFSIEYIMPKILPGKYKLSFNA